MIHGTESKLQPTGGLLGWSKLVALAGGLSVLAFQNAQAGSPLPEPVRQAGPIAGAAPTLDHPHIKPLPRRLVIDDVAPRGPVMTAEAGKAIAAVAHAALPPHPQLAALFRAVRPVAAPGTPLDERPAAAVQLAER